MPDWVTASGLAAYDSFIITPGAVFAIETLPLGMFLMGAFFFVLVWGGTPLIERLVNNIVDTGIKIIDTVIKYVDKLCDLFE